MAFWIGRTEIVRKQNLKLKYWLSVPRLLTEIMEQHTFNSVIWTIPDMRHTSKMYEYNIPFSVHFMNFMQSPFVCQSHHFSQTSCWRKTGKNNQRTVDNFAAMWMGSSPTQFISPFPPPHQKNTGIITIVNRYQATSFTLWKTQCTVARIRGKPQAIFCHCNVYDMGHKW
jgi:hypothetical protein